MSAGFVFVNFNNPGEADQDKRLAYYDSDCLTVPIPYGRLPDPSYLDNGPKDPFDTYPVPYQTWFGWLQDFWYSILPKSNRLVKTTPERMNAYITWSRRIELTEPALFYTSLFLASGIPVANGSLGVDKALWLRGRAVRAVNEALSDPERATSNALISAVGKIALHEHIYGDRQAAHLIHLPAQQRMIAMRGGIEKLGLPNITLQLMTWYDAFMAAEMGTTAYFAHLPKKLGLSSFSNEEAVKVTNVSSPQRYRHPGYGTAQSPEMSEVRAAGSRHPRVHSLSSTGP
ncbi:hypothetical protein LTR36_007637 [Oleoguttula mirabilis]|uniref:Uncharacterized protein n=1 Tax=Oleoguttula mirabilis TaxID=1507867 RepID=A0AAV9JX34_9PEZI|nr:hypothetical protein LTR36_007637 [Oleoguttula mirabilis]